LCQTRDKYRRGWHWRTIIEHNKFEQKYWCNSMVCATRLSKTLLSYITRYVQINKRLLFLEAFFPIIAVKYNLIYNTPSELSTIKYRHDWTIDNIIKSNAYHPVKNIDSHVELRLSLSRI
jgi:hypothetical protein